MLRGTLVSIAAVEQGRCKGRMSLHVDVLRLKYNQKKKGKGTEKYRNSLNVKYFKYVLYVNTFTIFWVYVYKTA